MEQSKVNDCCPICGHQFELDLLDETFDCKTCYIIKLTKDDLIHEDDDYAWVI